MASIDAPVSGVRVTQSPERDPAAVARAAESLRATTGHALMHGMASRKPTDERARRGPLLRAISNWDDVRIFLAIHRAGSLSAAAGPLEITQPTCGRRLAALEARLVTKELVDEMNRFDAAEVARKAGAYQ